MIRVYISGPITGMPGLNQAAFSEVEKTLYALGYSPVNPFSVCANIGSNPTWRDYMRKDIQALCRCDKIFLLPGWWKSKGARIEWILSKILGIDTIKLDISRTRR